MNWNSCRYSSSLLSNPKKFSITALSRQFPLRLMLCRTPFSRSIDDLHPHKLRHSFASIAITNGADIASVSEKLGHSDKAVTLRNVYPRRCRKHEAGKSDFQRGIKKDGSIETATKLQPSPKNRNKQGTTTYSKDSKETA